LVGYYQSLIERLVQEPQRAYSELSLVGPEEYQKVIYDWNDTDKEYPKDKTIQELFEEQVARTPDNIALVYEGEQLTYKELNEKSNQLARYIRSQYKERTGQELIPDTLIPLCLDRSLEMVVGILGVLKAGGVYVPIDPDYPQERINYILEDTRAVLVLSQKYSSKGLGPVTDRVLTIDLNEDLFKNGEENLSPQSSAEDLAYIIYTSGTTGKPKGVMVEHQAILNTITNLFQIYTGKEKVSAYTSYVFDVSVSEIITSLVRGSELHILSTQTRKDSVLLSEYLIQNKINLAYLPPVMLSALPKKQYPDLDQMIYAGEPCDKQTAGYWSGRVKLYNYYGPTEVSVYATGKQIQGSEVEQIGIPMQNNKAYVLDRNLNPVPIGIIGELYLGGAGLARGYLNNETLTKKSFIINPFASEADKQKGYTRLYKTGDLVRWLPDGNLEYLGRNDEQVKIRGYRIELGEIEHALQQIEGVKQSFVLAKEREMALGKNKYLVGYYVVDQGAKELTSSEIVKQLSTRLPEYMVPSALMALESFPLTINGKLDKRALPDPNFVDKKSSVAPVTETERALSKIWSEVLGIEHVGVEDNFFRIGGDSILSIQVSSRIRQLGFNCRVKDILTYKTISRLAAYLDSNTDRIEIQSEQGLLAGEVGMLPIQQWFFDNVDNGQFTEYNHWNQSFLIRVPELNQEKLTTAIQELISYHDALRINFIKTEHWHQFYRSHIEVPEIKLLNVSHTAPDKIFDVLTEWQKQFDLKSGSLYSIGYLYGYEDGSARIYIAMHHLIVDGVSWRIIAEDLKRLYAQETLQSKGSSYRQWVKTLSKYTEQHANESEYWLSQLTGLPAYIAGEWHEPSVERIKLSEELTQSLLHETLSVYATEINDLLLTALAYALRDINGRHVQGITLEGHGRELIDPTIDHSHTIGWYTSMYPVRLELGLTIGESICKIKEELRSIPNKGIGFGAFAVSKETEYGFSDLPPISFNYLGQFGTGEENDWQIVSESSGQMSSPLNKEHLAININGSVSAGELSFHFATCLGQETTRKLATGFKTHLSNIVTYCLAQPVREELHPSYHLQSYCYSIYKEKRRVLVHGLINRRVKSLNKDAFTKALHTLVLRHESLRTIFTEQNGKLFQKISPSNNFKAPILFDDVSNENDKTEKINRLIGEMNDYSFDYEKEYSFKCKLIKCDDSSHTVVMVIDHIVNDVFSLKVVEDELFQLYKAYSEGKPNPLQPNKLQLKDYVRYHNQHYSGEKLAFHQARVRKIFKDLPSRIKLKPLYAPQNSIINSSTRAGGYWFILSEDILMKVQQISSEMEISMYSFFVTCYSIFLSEICLQNDFVIDSPTTTRSNEDFARIVGWLGGTLSLRVKINEDLSFREFAQLCNNGVLESLEHIHFHNYAFNLGVAWNHLATQMNLISTPETEVQNIPAYHYDMQSIYFDFMCAIQEMKDGLAINLRYRHDLIDKALISDIANIFTEVVKMAVQSPDIKLKDWREVSVTKALE
jgi:amino acid adenylation domain-containing protein/non-ribosomal peptide synthase protein (TIGR01720 family)